MAMTTEGAYLPCLNSACKSKGKSHPHCRCYPGLAEGGEVDSSYCSKARNHKEDCPYYVMMADGGEIPPGEVTLDPAKEVNPTYNDPLEQINPSEVKVDAPEEIDPKGVKVDSDASEPSMGNRALAAVEGGVKGVYGPLGTFAEQHAKDLPSFAKKVIGDVLVPGSGELLKDYAPSQEELATRSEMPEHALGEGAGMVGGLLTGTGEAGLIAKGAKFLAPEATTILGKIGSKAIQGALEGGILRGTDEVSNAMLGTGDPHAPVAAALANMGAASLFGAATGGIFGGLGGGIEKLGASKLGPRLNEFMAGVGAASKVANSSPELAEAMELQGSPSFMAGVKFNKKFPDFIAKAATAPVGPAVFEAAGGGEGGMMAATAVNKMITPYIEKMIGRPISSVLNKYVVPTALRLMSQGATPEELLSGVNYATTIARGVQKMNNAVDSVFKGGGIIAAPLATESHREKLRKYVEGGELQKQVEAEAAKGQRAAAPQETPAFAQGGEIPAHEVTPKGEPTPVLEGTGYLAKHYPDQNTVMQDAKGRVNGYLNLMRPDPNPSQLPFDNRLPNKEKNTNYNNALDIANAPLTVLNHIQRGTLTPSSVTHLKSMYPEVYDSLSQMITQRISGKQMKDQKIPYKTRMGLSLFLGAPLDSTMTPRGIATIQTMYASKKAQNPPPKGGVKEATANSMMKTNAANQTNSQALAARQLRAR